MVKRKQNNRYMAVGIVYIATIISQGMSWKNTARIIIFRMGKSIFKNIQIVLENID